MPNPARTPGPGRITAGEAHRRAQAGEAVLLDVRERAEYVAGHAPGIAWQPLTGVAVGASPLPQAQSRPLMVICRSENRSQRMAGFLTARGVQAIDVEGGMHARAAAGFPVEDAAGRQGQAV